MTALIRLLWVAFILVLAVLCVSFVAGIGTPSTGPVEKVVLIGLFALCVYLAARSTGLATRLQAKVHHH
jgi:hypothetical protein